MQKGFNKIIVLVILALVIILATVFALTQKTNFFNRATTSSSTAVRGQPYDFWADKVIGKRDFGEISPNEVVPYKVFRPGGTVVDRSVSPGRLYVWDGGNNRILGIDLSKCYGSNSPCSANIVIGQPIGTDMGGCNNDSSNTTFPNRRPASNQSLCGLPENTFTSLEDKSLVTMAVDSSGNLYVPDSFNHRVLKFNSPFTTDTIADDVWGQPDFQSNGCNITGDSRSGISGGPAPKPTASSLCFHAVEGEGSAVAFDAQGNMWVVDGGNNRVLRFPNTNGSLSKTADLVIGHSDFTTGGDWSQGSDLNQLHYVQGLAFDASGNLYLADSGNNRLLKFSPPFTNNMNGTVLINNIPGGILAAINDSQNRGIWIRSNNIHSVFALYSYTGEFIASVQVNNYGDGGFDFDNQNNILVPTFDDNDVFKLTPDSGGLSYSITQNLFSPPLHTSNLPLPSRFFHPAWGGITVADNQLIVAVNHLRFWNNPTTVLNGQGPNGFTGVTNDNDNADPEFGQISTDQDHHLWVTRQRTVEMYTTPLTTGQKPTLVLNLINTLGGGSIALDSVVGVAATPHSEFLWISETGTSRVLRIKNPLTSPLIDTVIGQTSTTGANCNRNIVPARDPGVDLTMLCNPGALSLDKKGNLYVADHFIEAVGNYRTLMFAPNLFPANPTSIIFAPAATKEFPKQGISQDWAHLNFQAAFDSTNRMVVGNNPYSGKTSKKRLLEYYNDPTKVNPTNPRDPSFAEADGNLNDFYGWPIGLAFDQNDNLYVYDANRGQVRIYLHPFPGQLVPKFVATPTSGRSPISVQFTNQTVDLGNSPTFLWDFGDGVTSTAFSPTHTYTAITSDPTAPIKTLTVSLKATGPFSSSSTSQTISLTPNVNPVGDFTYVVSPGINKATNIVVTVAYTATGSDKENDALTYNWNFGDGTTGTGKAINHTYSIPRLKTIKYNVVLNITDSHQGSFTVQKSLTLPQDIP